MNWESTISPSAEEPERDGRGPDGDDESDTPALFVTSMPRDLWANPSLGALAALIDEDHEEHQDRGCQDEGEDGPDEGVDVDDDGLDDQEDDDADRDDQRLRQTVRQEDRDGGESVRTSSDRFCPGSMRSVGNGGGGTSSYESMPDAATATVTATAFPGNNTVAPRRRRRDEVQLKRNERRASPYSTSLVSRPTARQEAKAKANAKSTRAKANAKSTRAKANAKSTRASTDGGTYGGRNGKKAGPTAGETQVLMSLWAL